MSKPRVIEVAGTAVAVAAPAGDRFRFVAVKYDVWDLDGEFFATVAEAERAASRHLAGRLTGAGFGGVAAEPALAAAS